MTNYKIWVNCKYLDYDEVEDNVNIVQPTPTKYLQEQEQDTSEVNIYSYRINNIIFYLSNYNGFIQICIEVYL